jgi:hypothetical protein
MGIDVIRHKGLWLLRPGERCHVVTLIDKLKTGDVSVWEDSRVLLVCVLGTNLDLMDALNILRRSPVSVIRNFDVVCGER